MSTRLTRRRFLRNSLVTTSSLIVAPQLIPAAALGRDGGVAPSERICMGFVGLGGQGGGHLFGGAWTYLPGGYLGREDVQVLGVCDVQRKRAEDAQGRVARYYAERAGRGNHAACQAYDDIRELVANPAIDAVLIAAAYHAAATNSLIALRAGKDVYCEKPTSVTIPRAGRWPMRRPPAGGCIRPARSSGPSMRDDSAARWNWYEAARSAGSSGSTRTRWVAASHRRPRRIAEAPFRPTSTGKPTSTACPGSTTTATPAPTVSAGATSIGANITTTLSNGAPMRTAPAPRKSGWKMANRSCATPRASRSTAVRRPEKAGMKAVPPLWDRQDRSRSIATSWFPIRRDLLRQTPVPNHSGVYHSNSHSGNFLECVRTRQPTICNAESTHRASSLLLLGGIAMKLGRTLKWDPVREEFPDAPDANRLLTLTAREPWRYC